MPFNGRYLLPFHGQSIEWIKFITGNPVMGRRNQLRDQVAFVEVLDPFFPMSGVFDHIKQFSDGSRYLTLTSKGYHFSNVFFIDRYAILGVDFLPVKVQRCLRFAYNSLFSRA